MVFLDVYEKIYKQKVLPSSVISMGINFIKNIYEGKVDDYTHLKFTRYSRGRFEKEPITIKVTGKKVKVQTGPEYAEVLLRILADHAASEVSLKGKIISTKDINKRIESYDVEVLKKWGKKYDVSATIPAPKFKEMVYEFEDCYLLLTCESGGDKVKVKTALPKPGELKEKFVTADFTKEHMDDIKSEFLFDVSDFKKEASIKHTYVIDEIAVDESLIETDPERARLEAKRKGKIIRDKTIDGKNEISEIEMDV